MKESFRQAQLDNKNRVSRTFERAWRIFSLPQNYSLEEVEWARDFVVGQYDNWNVAVNSSGYPVSPEELDMVFAGLYHRGITPPPTRNSTQNSN